MELDMSELKEDLPGVNRPTVHVEVSRKTTSTVPSSFIQEKVLDFFQNKPFIYGDMCLSQFTDSALREHVEKIVISDTDHLIHDKKKGLNLSEVNLKMHVYQLNQDGPAEEELEEEELAAASQWLLPSQDFQGLWESLIFDSHIKNRLLQYATTTHLFSDKGVDCNMISWNRVVLLHGPPGTGKTSLCKALAHKLTVRLSHRYSYGQLVEINSHSLFSKWFSESGKLVMKMFQKIQDLIDDKDSLVCVLIDEVESLTAARKAAMSGNEPSDAIRVVNALLTQIDNIKNYPNVIILTTSNITGAIDLAFVDRADIKQYIGPPSPTAIYKIYQSCMKELIRTGIIKKDDLLDIHELDLFRDNKTAICQHSLQLQDLAVKSEGLSGRTLRKLPFLAHAHYIQSPVVTLANFLDALKLTIDQQFQDRQDLEKVSG